MKGLEARGNNTHLYTVFSRRMRIAMHERKLTCADLSGLTGISNASLSAYVNGHRPPGYDHLYLLCVVLGVSPNFLMGIGDKRNETDES